MYPSVHLQKTCCTNQFSSVPWPNALSGGHEGQFSRDLVQSFQKEALGSHSRISKDVHSLILSIQHFLCWQRHCHPPRCPKGWFWRSCHGMWHAWTMHVSRQFLDSCQRRFLWTQKEADLALHPVVGLVLQEGDTEKFPQALGFERMDTFFFSQEAGSMFLSCKGGWRWQETCRAWTCLSVRYVPVAKGQLASVSRTVR